MSQPDRIVNSVDIPALIMPDITDISFRSRVMLLTLSAHSRLNCSMFLNKKEKRQKLKLS
jgi:hypothetical protein